MDEGSKDISEGSKKGPARIGRRRFLSLAGTVGAMGALAALGYREENTIKASTLGPIQDNSSQLTVVPSEIATVASASPSPTETPVKKETPEELKKRMVYTSSLFKNCNDKEKEIALQAVNQQVEHYKNKATHKDPKVIRNTWEAKARLGVQEAFKKLEEIKYPADPFIRDIILPLIFAESGGVEGKVSSKGARGVCQVTQIAIDDIAKFVKISHKTADMDNSHTNIIIATEYLARLAQIFGDASLAATAYNWGALNIRLLSKNHLKKIGASPAVIERYDDGFDPEKKRFASADIIEGYNINYLRILNELPDETKYFVPRLAAAACLLEADRLGIIL